MKKLFYLLFICSVVLASCTKEGDDVEAVQVTCDCGDSSNGTDSLNITGSLSTIIDPNLVGHWKVTGLNSVDNQWNNGEAILHFFADGDVVVNIINTNAGVSTITSEYKTHSNRCIQFSNTNIILNYSTENGVLTFSNPTGFTDYRVVLSAGATLRVVRFEYIDDNQAEINNLIKQ